MKLTSPQLHAPLDAGAFGDWAIEHGWSDGLPLVPPTPARVEAMVAGCGRPPEDEVAVIEPCHGLATVEKIAINAVMAGCKPEYMPVVIAAVEALVDPAVNHAGVQATTNPAGPMVIVNGPIRNRISLAYGPDALGPGNRANQTIGRALRLVMRMIGGGVPPRDQSIQGSPWKMGLVVGENEEASPWEPLHVERGFSQDQSVVTVVNSESIINVPAGYTKAESIVTMLARAMTNGINMHTSNGVLPVGLNVGHARMLADAGYEKQQLKEELFERAKLPLAAYPPEGNLPMNVWELDGDRVLPTRDANHVLVFVFGGDVPYHSLYFGGWGVSGSASRAIIEP